MINLRFWLGLIPDTTRFEDNMIALEREYHELLGFHETVMWKRYEELEHEVNSKAFIHKLEAIQQSKFDNSPEHEKQLKWEALKAKKSLQTYFKVKKSGSLARFQAYETSGKPNRVIELEAILASNDFQTAKELPKKEFQKSAYFTDYEEYKKLTGSSDYKFWTSFKQSEKYKTYLQEKDSKELHQFTELDTFVHSEQFLKRKEYLKLPPKKKVELSEENYIILEHKQMLASKEIQWFLANRNHKKFEWLRNWKLVFSDEFNTEKLDTDKWLTRYYYGETILGQSYSLETDKHYITEGKNIEVKASTCSIATRNEKATGQVWSSSFGFMPKEFSVTSGLINTGKSFRSAYGTIRAKVRFNGSHPITHAFWLAADKSLPQIDIFKFENKKLITSNFHGNAADVKSIKVEKTKLSASKMAEGYWIIELEWAPNLLIWRVNGLEIQRLTQNIPSEEMYMVFSSGLYNDQQLSQPVDFDIDWVRWYKKREKHD